MPDGTHPGEYHYIGAAESALSPADTAMCIKTAPILDASPILDVSLFGGEGTGGDSAVGSTIFQGGTTGHHGGGYPAPTAGPLATLITATLRKNADGCQGKYATEV